MWRGRSVSKPSGLLRLANRKNTSAVAPTPLSMANLLQHPDIDRKIMIHQYARREDQWATNQEAMKLLMDTLVSSQMLVPPVSSTLSSENNEISPKEETYETWNKYFNDLGSSENLQEELSQDLSMVKSNDDRVHDRAVLNRESYLRKVIHAGNVEEAMGTFQFLVKSSHQIHEIILGDLFYLLASKHRPFDAKMVLDQYINQTAKSINNYAQMFERLADSMRKLDPSLLYNTHIRMMVEYVIQCILRLDDVHRRRCFPVLLSALAEQKSVLAGKYCTSIYNYMIKNKYVMAGNYLEHILSLSKYYRQSDLPYGKILAKTVALGHRVKATSAMPAIENYFPYTNMEQMKEVLTAVHAILKAGYSDFIIDIAMLEVMGVAAVNKGSTEVTLLIWDILDLMDCAPTEAIYENTAMVFSMCPETYESLLEVLLDMEQNAGFVPSRGLIRGISVKMRHSLPLIDEFLGLVRRKHDSGIAATVACLNIPLSAYAERGNIRRTEASMSDFSYFGLEPNADSFSFAMEALGKHVFRKNADDQLIKTVIEQADALLSEIENREIGPTHHIIRAYAELLCLTDDTETATHLVRLLLKNDRLLDNKTIYRVAMANIARHRFDLARQLANSGTEPMPFLLDNIKKEEELAQANKKETDVHDDH